MATSWGYMWVINADVSRKQRLGKCHINLKTVRVAELYTRWILTDDVQVQIERRNLPSCVISWSPQNLELDITHCSCAGNGKQMYRNVQRAKPLFCSFNLSLTLICPVKLSCNVNIEPQSWRVQCLASGFPRHFIISRPWCANDCNVTSRADRKDWASSHFRTFFNRWVLVARLPLWLIHQTVLWRK